MQFRGYPLLTDTGQHAKILSLLHGIPGILRMLGRDRFQAVLSMQDGKILNLASSELARSEETFLAANMDSHGRLLVMPAGEAASRAAGLAHDSPIRLTYVA